MVKRMTNREMVSTVNAIENMQTREAAEGIRLFKDKIKVNYAVRKNKRQLLDALQPYQEERDILLKEYGNEYTAGNGQLNIRKECQQEWANGIKELLSIESEVDIHMIALTDMEGLELSMNDLEALDFMIEEME